MLRKKKVLCPENAASPSDSSSKKKADGQSTVEYIILVAAVIGAILIFAPTFKIAFQKTLNQGTNGMENMANRLAASRP